MAVALVPKGVAKSRPPGPKPASLRTEDSANQDWQGLEHPQATTNLMLMWVTGRATDSVPKIHPERMIASSVGSFAFATPGEERNAYKP